MDAGLYTDRALDFLNEDIAKRLEIFFANTNLSREQRNEIVDFLTDAYDTGYSFALPEDESI